MAIPGFASPIQMEYDNMLAQKRSAEQQYRSNAYSDFDHYNNSAPAPQSNNYARDPRDVEKQLKMQERQQRQKYAEELRQQAEEQKQKRQRDNNIYSQPTITAEPPWLRGNPQPKSGVRVGPGYLPPAQDPYSLQRQRSLPMDYNNDPTRTAFARQRDLQIKQELERQIEEKRLIEHRKRMEDDRYGRQKQMEAEAYDPWGKGGGGAPMRDGNGRLLADRRKMNQVAADPYAQSYPNGRGMHSAYTSMPNITPKRGGGPAGGEKDEYREILALQIEDKKRQRELEKLKQQEDDERDRRNFEQYQKKQQAEMDAEKNKHKHKQEAAAKKQAELQAKREQKLAEAYEEAQKNNPKAKRRNQNKNQPDDGLEWWERQDGKKPALVAEPAPNVRQLSHKSAKPRVAEETDYKPLFPDTDQRAPPSARKFEPLSEPAERTKLPDDTRRPIPLESPPTPRKAAAPRSAAQRNENALRQLSAMREKLQKEQHRVKSAIKRRDYRDTVFDNDRDLDRSAGALLREKDELDKYIDRVEIGSDEESPDFNKNRRRKKSDKNSDRRAAPEKRRDEPERKPHPLEPDRDFRYVPPPNINDDDDDLIRALKNARSGLVSAPKERDRNANRGRNHTKLFDDSDDDEFQSKAKSRNRRRAAVDSEDSDEPDKVVDSYLKNRDLRPTK